MALAVRGRGNPLKKLASRKESPWIFLPPLFGNISPDDNSTIVS